jgi:DNA-binding transcriptional regulator YdaS (Cro superfamily)
MRHSRIIDELADSLGSQAELARRLGVDDTQVCKWKIRGIPARYWPAVRKVATGRIKLSIKDIEADSPLRPAKPARAA